MKRFGFALILLLSIVLSGCVSSILATRIVKAPNQQSVPRIARDAKYAERYDQTYAQAWRLPVGPPAAELSVAVIEPGDYQFRYSFQIQARVSDGALRPRYSGDWKPRSDETRGRTPRGTVLLLHGFLMAKESMMHWALHLAEQGYRSVLVDLRGHGRSTGDWVTFGDAETKDLRRLLDDLQHRGLMEEKVGLVGISYGAVMGLLLAGNDTRVSAIVAIEPFSHAETAVVEFARGFYGKEAAKISDADFASATKQAARKASFSWKDVDVLAAVEKMSAAALFVHGEKDTWIPPRHSEVLHQRATGPKAYGTLKGDNHLTLAARLEPVASEVVKWLDRYLPKPSDKIAEAAAK